MPVDTPSTGHPMKLYYNSVTDISTAHASPTWVEVDEIGDVTIPDLSRGMAELKRRASDFTKNLATLIQSINVEFRLHHGLDPTTFDVLVAAFFAGTIMEWLILDHDEGVSGSQGLRMACLLEQFPWDQPLEDVSGHDIRLAVAYWESPAGTEVDPEWYVDAGP